MNWSDDGRKLIGFSEQQMNRSANNPVLSGESLFLPGEMAIFVFRIVGPSPIGRGRHGRGLGLLTPVVAGASQALTESVFSIERCMLFYRLNRLFRPVKRMIWIIQETSSSPNRLDRIGRRQLHTTANWSGIFERQLETTLGTGFHRTNGLFLQAKRPNSVRRNASPTSRVEHIDWRPV